MTTYKLVTIDQRFTAETIARTGSEQLLEKAMRSFVGLYNEEESWYIPLRANLGKKKKDTAIFKTPFPTTNPHFKNPGLDFEKAVYVPGHYVMEIKNTLPEEQSKLIFENQEVIRNKFEDYVLSVDSMEKDNNNYLFSTVPLFPEGIEKIKQIQQVREEMKSFTLNNTDKKENTELTQANSTDEYLIAEKSKTEEKGNSEEPSLKEYKYITARIVELERKTEYEEGDLEELVALRSRAQSILTVEQKEHIIEFLKTQSAGEHIKIITSDDGMTDEIYFGDTFIEKKVNLFEEKAFHTWSNFLISNFETTPYSINYIDLENAGYNPNTDINYYKNHKENIDNQETYKKILAVDNEKGVALQYSIQKYQLPQYKLIDKTGQTIEDETMHMELDSTKNYFFNRNYFNPLDEYELDLINNKYEEYTLTDNEQEIGKFQIPLSETKKSESVIHPNQQINIMTLETAITNKDYKFLKEHLEKGIESYLDSDTYKKFLACFSSFNDYSQKNMRLLLAQLPTATMVAKASDWKNLGRFPSKGTKALRIYGPNPEYKKDEEGNYLKDEKGKKIPTGNIAGWKLVPVFDVSQTHGKELPKPIYELTESFKEPKHFLSIFNAVKSCTTASISLQEISREGVRGFYNRDTNSIVIRKGMNQYQTLKTEIHEVAHSILHQKASEFISKEQKEFEAESVAYIVCQNYGVDTSDYTFAYLSSWTNKGERIADFENSLKTITNTAREIIKKIDKELSQELTIKENKIEERTNKFSVRLQNAQRQLGNPSEKTVTQSMENANVKK